ncbi:hypothetical protein DSL72_006125 [Monilinia vaccinii-corymbosi]|uniref:Major facilitator superfamily (MFS) profile domain-containing protein n=1 Tax=Monilinia vaccinii-corymbosi TaxID=61207 RepID=A0A8A3PHR5_9HELO|nr:hypothetical protein DSL72_006125 [Monilinia vaccinii-corymbosi]
MATQNSSEITPLLNPSHETQSETPYPNGDISDPISSVPDDPSTLYVWINMIGPFLSAFVASVDSSMIATLSSPITSSFGSLSHLPWLASAYFIANAAIQPLSGKLTDIYGRRSGLVLSNVFFSLGNYMCASAQSEWFLIAGRVVAGLGGGGVMAVATFLLSDIVPLRERGMWQGIGNMILGVGSGIGGVLGGWINDSLDWRAAFLLQIPITILATTWAWFTIRIPTVDDVGGKSKLKRIDYLGSISLFTTLVTLLLGMSAGGNTVTWTDPIVLTSLPLSLVSFTIFILAELKYATEPIIPLPLLYDISVAGGCLSNAFSSASRFAMIFYLPLFLESQGYTATQIGLRLIPGSIGTAIASMIAGIIVKSTGRFYKLGVASQLIYILGMAFHCTFTSQTPAWPPYIWFCVINIGYGITLTTTILALLSSVNAKDQAVITSALFAFRSTGTVLGISTAGLTFQNVLGRLLWEKLGGIDNAPERIQKIIDDFRVVNGLEEGLKELALQAYMGAVRAVFFLMLGLGMLALVAALLVRDRELSSRMSQ